LNEVVMAADMRKNGTVGCAYYVAREETLYLMPDALLGGKDTLDTRKVRSACLEPGTDKI
jgi:DNA mismatch repair protein MSH5